MNNEKSTANKLVRISRKSIEGNSTNKENSSHVADLVSAHFNVANQAKKRAPSTPKSHAFSSKRVSPGDTRKQPILRHKMKKVVSNSKHFKDKNLDWFESDKVFGFHE